MIDGKLPAYRAGHSPHWVMTFRVTSEHFLHVNLANL
jgi:hypothetical protein